MIVEEFESARGGIEREWSLFERGEPAVVLWRTTQRSLVVPHSMARRAGFEPVAESSGRAGWSIALRSTGGGVVPQGPETLNMALVAPLDTDARIEDGYRVICGAIAEALRRFDVQTDVGSVKSSFCDGKWNVVVDGRKLAGTAQRWRRSGNGRSVALIHAAIASDTHPDLLWPVLTQFERLTGGGAEIKQDVHVALSELISASIRMSALHGALKRSAEEWLQMITKPRTEEVRAA